MNTGLKPYNLKANSDVSWLYSEDIRPYIYMRRENLFKDPGSRISGCDWFTQNPFNNTPIYKDPLKMGDVGFADQILSLETKAFHHSAMPMPRWVFYDCGVMPGFVCGFAKKTSSLSAQYKSKIGVIDDELEWTPISLFIIIPTVRSGEWVAHNLCTANALVEKHEKNYALGFLTKAFGLWYANVEILCGMTQWHSPAIKLHSHYGQFEILTSYTPVHSYARTLTYRSQVDFGYWPSFFDYDERQMGQGYKYAGFEVDPNQDSSLKELQLKIEGGEGPFYLSPSEIRNQKPDSALKVYKV